jgi:hypothetical protein
MRKLFVWATGIRKGLAAHFNVLLVNTLGFTGFSLVLKGLAIVSEPLAWIVGGLGLIFASAILSRTPKT